MTEFGEAWLEAVRLEASRRSVALLAGDVHIGLLGLSANLVVLGASAMPRMPRPMPAPEPKRGG